MFRTGKGPGGGQFRGLVDVVSFDAQGLLIQQVVDAEVVFFTLQNKLFVKCQAGELVEMLCMRVYSWHIERKYLNDWETRRESKFEVSRHTSAFFPVNYERKVLDNQRPQPAFTSLSA